METLEPKLRFPEFEGNWKTQQLGDVGDIKMCRRIFNQETTTTGDIPFFKIGSFGKVADAFISKELYLNYRSRFSFPKKGDILISAAGTIGRTVVYNGEDAYFQDSNIVWIDNDNTITSNEFLFYVYQIVSFNTEGGTIQRLYNNILKSTKFFNPSLEEQTKIANFLSAVDKKLKLLIEKKTLLEDYKKGLMQKIFNQEIRFKDDNGNDFEDWEEKTLGELCEYKNGGSFEKYVCDDGIYNLISLNSIDINGKIKNSHKKVSITDNSLQKGDLIMVLSDVAHGNFLGLTDIVPDDNFVLNQRMGALKPILNFNSFYLKTIINFNQSYFKLMGKGSSQQNLSKGDIECFNVILPCIAEQTKIANFISAIDDKIELVSNQIQDTQEYKKGLLQQMFVLI